LAQIILILQRTKPLKNWVQHCNIVKRRWRHIKMPKCRNAVYRQRQTFNKSFSKGKTRHCKSIAERICKQKLESLLI